MGRGPLQTAAWYSEGSEEENEHPGSFFSDSGLTRGLSLATSGSTDGAATVWFRWAFTLRAASHGRHHVTYPESGLFKREKPGGWMRLLKFAVWGGGCPRRSLSDPVSYLSTCALFSSSGQKHKPASPPARLVLAGVERRWAALRGLRQRGVPPVLGWSRASALTGPFPFRTDRGKGSGPRPEAQSRPFPGTPLAQLRAPLGPHVPGWNFLHWNHDAIFTGILSFRKCFIACGTLYLPHRLVPR